MDRYILDSKNKDDHDTESEYDSDYSDNYYSENHTKGGKNIQSTCSTRLFQSKMNEINCMAVIFSEKFT